MTQVIGARVSHWTTDAIYTAGGTGFGLGDHYHGPDGKVYVFVQLGTGGVTGDGYVCSIGEDGQAVMVDTDTASTFLEGDRIGVAEGAGSDNDYGWLQVYGACGIYTEQDALANKKLAGTSVAGHLDDAGATGLFLNGMHLGTATGGSDAVNTTGFVNYPTVEIQMEPEV